MLGLVLLVHILSSAFCSEAPSRHRRAWIIDSFTIEEGHPGPYPYALGKINIERNYLVHFDIYGDGVNLNPKGVISIDQEGTLFVHKPVDYEEKRILKLTFEVRKINDLIDTKLGVEIQIKDINDNPPYFQKSLYEISINEETTQGSDLLRVVAYDRDQRGTPNGTFHYEIKRVSPRASDTEFFIDKSGAISFKGCLNYEVVKTFTMLVEAIDHGEVVSLSSSTTVVIHVQDGNDHMPTITGRTGTARVLEEETGSSPLRLHVADRDARGSPAWRARYVIEGDKGEHFKIETDPDTNDGILTVVRPLDFEEGAQRELSISVENEAPFFSCKVLERTPSRLWTLDASAGVDSRASQRHSVRVTIEVEDANDPPAFTVAVKEAALKENSPVGTWVEKVTAVDHDSSHARNFLYKVGHDPAGWLIVDPHTGDITTIKTPDRESPHVVDSVYSILLHAVDDGTPQMTGTSTLQIHISDQNDNVPHLTTDHLDVCVSDTVNNITASDLDGNPFGGPFTFELLGDVRGKWKLNPSHGYTAGLVKQPGVYLGQHTINVKISDMQGEFGVYNVSVTVCNCSGTPICQTKRHTSTKAASYAVGIVFASLLLFLFLLLMAVAISCKKEFAILQTDVFSGETLLISNIEIPGTDCQVPNRVGRTSVVSKVDNKKTFKRQNINNVEKYMTFSTKHIENRFYENYINYRRETMSHQFNSWNHKHLLSFKDDTSTMNFLYNDDTGYMTTSAVPALLHWRLSYLQETEDDQDYQPHLYTQEGDSDDLSELEDLSIPDDDDKSFQTVLRHLGSKFNQLALICQPSEKDN